MSIAARPALVTVALSLLAAGAYLALRSAGVVSVDDPSTVGTEAAEPLEASTVPSSTTWLPEFVLDDLDGVPTPITSWPGKALVINFWATWCAPCLREIPMLKAFQNEHADIQIVGIAIDNIEPVKDFAADMDFNYPVLVGAGAMDAAIAFGVEYLALPLTVFVDSEQRVVATHLGELDEVHLADAESVFADLAAGRRDLESARALLEARR